MKFNLLLKFVILRGGVLVGLLHRTHDALEGEVGAGEVQLPVEVNIPMRAERTQGSDEDLDVFMDVVTALELDGVAGEQTLGRPDAPDAVVLGATV